MEDTDIVIKLRNENEEFKKLEGEHRKLEESLDEINKKKYLSANEEMNKKNLQKQKLQYKDRMAQMLKEFSN